MVLLCLKYFAKTNIYSATTETYSGQKDLGCVETAVFHINSELATVNNNKKKGGL